MPKSAGSGPAVTLVVVGADVGTTETSSATLAVSAVSTLAGGTMLGVSLGDTDSSSTIVAGGSTATVSETLTDSPAGTPAGGATVTASAVPIGSSAPTGAGPVAVEPSPDDTLSSTTMATVLESEGAAPAGSTSRPNAHASASSNGSAHRTAALLPVLRPATVVPRSPPSYEKLSLTVTEMLCPAETLIGDDRIRVVIAL